MCCFRTPSPSPPRSRRLHPRLIQARDYRMPGQYRHQARRAPGAGGVSGGNRRAAGARPARASPATSWPASRSGVRTPGITWYAIFLAWTRTASSSPSANHSTPATCSSFAGRDNPRQLPTRTCCGVLRDIRARATTAHKVGLQKLLRLFAYTNILLVIFYQRA